MRAFETITTDISDGIFTLTLNRPDRMNAFTGQMMLEMVAALDIADADDAVRAVIVTGSGERAFCAGADLGSGGATFDYAKRTGELEGGSPINADGSVDYSHPGVRDAGGKLTLRIFNCKKPVIGAINGAAVGIGVTMQLPMDFRMASSSARFGFVFAKRGIVPEAASSWVPAAPRRDQPGVGLVLFGPGVRCRRSAGGRADPVHPRAGGFAPCGAGLCQRTDG